MCELNEKKCDKQPCFQEKKIIIMRKSTVCAKDEGQKKGRQQAAKTMSQHGTSCTHGPSLSAPH